MITAFEVLAKLGLDDSSFRQGVDKAEKSGKNLSNSLSESFGKIKKAAAAIVSVAVIKKGIDALRELASETAAVGDKIDKQSQVLGMSRKAYQEWDYILSQNGASIDSMNAAMKTLNKTMLSAIEDGGEAGDAFAKLGLHIAELQDLSSEDQFEAVVKAFQKMPAGAQKSALAVKLFGRQGMQLLPLLNNTETSIDELKQKAQELGFIMSDEAVDASVEYTDALDTMQRTFNGLKYSIGSKILPVLTSGMTKITNFAGKLKKAYDDRGLAGVWDTLKESFRNIKWPTWADVKNALERAWEGVKEGAKSVLKLVFGETPDGGIKFPTAEELWTKISSVVSTLWSGVSTLAKDVLKFVFGEDEDGNIKFPTPAELWEKIKTGLSSLWSGIQTFAKSILKLAFGEDSDGNIKFPTATEIREKVKTALSSMWEGVKAVFRDIAKLVFGENEDGSIKFPTAHELGEKVRSALTKAWEGVKTLFKEVGKLIFGEGDGGIKFPASAQEWWELIKGALTKLWNGVKELAKNVVNFALGALGLPTVEETIAKIKAWWRKVVKDVKLKLGFNVEPEATSTSTVQENGKTWTVTNYDTGGSTYENDEGFGAMSPQFAKGSLNVPYDMTARLHRGEAVLTASQARNYRDGSSDVNFDRLASVIGNAVKSAIEKATIRSYLNGRDITDEVNRNNMQGIKARRFAT